MIRLVTQFDPPGTQAVEAAIPGGCCGCCCCCCVASTVSISAVAAIQVSKQARAAPVRPSNWGVWVAVAAAAMVTSLIVAGIATYAVNALVSSSAWILIAFGLVMLIVWASMLWAAFRGVGFRSPRSRAAGFIVIGIVAFVVEFFGGAALIFTAFPVYPIAALGIIAFAIWRTLTPIRNFSDDQTTPPGPAGGPSSTGSFGNNDTKPPSDT